MARFFGGMGAATRGAMILIDRPRLWVWLITPLVVNFVVVILLGGMLITFLSKWSDTFHHHFAGADGKQSWWLWSLEWIAYLAAVGIALLAMVLIWKVLELILFGVAYARITEAVERERLKPGESLRPLTMLQDFLDAIFNAAILIAGFVFLFILSFIPGVAIFSVIFGVMWGGFVQGLDLLGVCRALRGDRRWKQIAFCLDNLADTLGLGLIGFAFSFIPILGPVLVASCAVGAVLVHADIIKRRAVLQ
jgi:uncharacterized protein involved in cysteine biosynthesis